MGSHKAGQADVASIQVHCGLHVNFPFGCSNLQIAHDCYRKRNFHFDLARQAAYTRCGPVIHDIGSPQVIGKTKPSSSITRDGNGSVKLLRFGSRFGPAREPLPFFRFHGRNGFTGFGSTQEPEPSRASRIPDKEKPTAFLITSRSKNNLTSSAVGAAMFVP